MPDASPRHPVPQMRVHEACPEEFIGSHYMQLYSLKVHSLVHELHDNFNRETSANFTFVGNFYKSLLTPLQVLRLCSEGARGRLLRTARSCAAIAISTPHASPAAP